MSRLSCGRVELGNCLGALRNGMLGKFTRKKQTDCSLDLARTQGCLLVVTSKARSFKSKSLEDIVDEGVQDRHASLGDTDLRVDLFEDLVDVRGVGLDSLCVPLAGGSLLWGLCRLLANCWSLCHFQIKVFDL